MNILVTGGLGYIGSHTAKLLLDSGHKVFILDNFSTGHMAALDERADWFDCDLRDFRSVQMILQEFTPDAVIHFAAKSIVSESMTDPYTYYENNLVGTLNLLKALADVNCNKIVFSSTAAVYGEPDSVPITESDATNPTNIYGHTKLAMERLIASLGFDYVALRYFNVAGAGYELGEAHRDETHLIPILLNHMLKGKGNFKVYGKDYDTPDGTCIRDYIHVLDLAEAHKLALDHLLSGGISDTFNLGSGRGYSVLEVIECVGARLQAKVKYEVVARRAGDPSKLIASNDKINHLLGWSPKLNLADMVNSAYDWHRSSRYTRTLRH